MTKLEWILTGTLGVLVVIVGALALLLWQRPGIGAAPPLPVVDAPVAPTPALARSTALLAFSTARAAAQAWQPDAQLAHAAATWTQGARKEDLLTGMATWDFTFVSPAAGALTVVSVIEDEAKLIAERSIAEAPALQDVSGWRIDSPRAVAQLMEAGGEAFLLGSGTTTMTASLSTAQENGQIEWFISLISKYTGDSFTVRLNATSGDLIAVETAP